MIYDLRFSKTKGSRNEFPCALCVLSLLNLRRLHKHRRPITQYFRDPRRNLRRVITTPDDRVGAEFARMGQHLAKRVVAGPFAQVRVKRNVATEQTLNPRADVP